MSSRLQTHPRSPSQSHICIPDVTVFQNGKVMFSYAWRGEHSPEVSHLKSKGDAYFIFPRWECSISHLQLGYDESRPPRLEGGGLSF